MCQKGICVIYLPEDPFAGAAEEAAVGADFLLNNVVIDLLMLRLLLSLRLNGSYALVGVACTGVAAERVA